MNPNHSCPACCFLSLYKSLNVWSIDSPSRILGSSIDFRKRQTQI
jgi:hypothetical protein